VSTGKRLRLSRIFRRNTGRTVIIALDHGRRHGPLRGIEDLRQTVKRVLKAEVDALMMTPAMIEKVADLIAGRVSVIARIDGTGTIRGPDETDDRLIASVARAVRVGADAVSVMVYLGSPREAQNLEKLARVVEDADVYGMPVLAEVLPRPPHLSKARDTQVIAYASRIAVELGADVIKTHYTGEGFEYVVKCTPAPIVILGGPRRETPLASLMDAYEAIRKGARGVAYGRNVFQFERPEVMAKALLYVVHEEVEPKEAMERALSDFR